jgi:hypothetical protein
VPLHEAAEAGFERLVHDPSVLKVLVRP